MTLGDIAHIALRYSHITAGMLALGSGAGAMIYKKGSPMHRQHGKLFFGSMMVMAGIGLYEALFMNFIAANVMGAMMALYLTFTAWLTAWREPGKTGRLEIAGAFWGLATVLTGATFGFRATSSPNGMFQQFPAAGYFMFASVALLGTILDARAVARGGLTGAARTTRHLWRMCFALFMATGSFFLGQARQFSPEIRASGILIYPAMAPFALLIYWLIRIRVWPSVRKLWSRGVVPPNPFEARS
jgi:hypothetical protein